MPGEFPTNISVSKPSWDISGIFKRNVCKVNVRVASSLNSSQFEDNTRYSESVELKLERNPMPVPTGLKWDGNKATWDKVPGARAYHIKLYKENNVVAGGGVVSMEAMYDWSDHIAENGNGTYKFCVQALAPDGSADYYNGEDSEFSEEKVVTDEKNKFKEPTGLHWEGNWHAMWDAVPEADGLAWYWLDNVQHGAKAVSKDVYQESYSAYPDREDGTGKWESKYFQAVRH